MAKFSKGSRVSTTKQVHGRTYPIYSDTDGTVREVDLTARVPCYRVEFDYIGERWVVETGLKPGGPKIKRFVVGQRVKLRADLDGSPRLKKGATATVKRVGTPTMGPLYYLLKFDDGSRDRVLYHDKITKA